MLHGKGQHLVNRWSAWADNRSSQMRTGPNRPDGGAHSVWREQCLTRDQQLAQLRGRAHAADGWVGGSPSTCSRSPWVKKYCKLQCSRSGLAHILNFTHRCPNEIGDFFSTLFFPIFSHKNLFFPNRPIFGSRSELSKQGIGAETGSHDVCLIGKHLSLIVTGLIRQLPQVHRLLITAQCDRRSPWFVRHPGLLVGLTAETMRASCKGASNSSVQGQRILAFSREGRHAIDQTHIRPLIPA